MWRHNGVAAKILKKKKKRLLFSCLMGLLTCRLIDSPLFLIPWMISESVFLNFGHRPRTIGNQQTSMVLSSAEDLWSTHLYKRNNNQTVLFSVSPVWDSIYFSVIDNHWLLIWQYKIFLRQGHSMYICMP